MPSSEFESAAKWLTTSPKASKQSNNEKLEIYALYKIVNVSARPVKGSRPGMLDFTGRAKWDAWESIGKKYEGEGSASEKAQERYLEIARGLGWKEKDLPAASAASEDGSESGGGGGGVGIGFGTKVSALGKEEEDQDEETVHGFAVSGNLEKLKAYFDANSNVDVDALDDYGYTPLHLASDRGHVEAVKFLLSKGANIGVKDADGHSSIALARDAGNDEIVKLLEAALVGRGEEGQAA